ncbi:hypothetical protein Vi05172_g12861 [Venturia inaequalis]|nr:hypothetical protein Vi05172_g12861 [Venturia inaequalis]
MILFRGVTTWLTLISSLASNGLIRLSTKTIGDGTQNINAFTLGLAAIEEWTARGWGIDESAEQAY